MESLYSIITAASNKAYYGEDKKIQSEIDGHIHLFDSDENILELDKGLETKRLVGFIDIEPGKLDQYKNSVAMYDKFIKKSYDPNKHILLASALNIDDIKRIYNKYPNIIKGFGEIKCYDIFKGEKIGTKNTKLIKEVCKFSESVGNLPIYIHYSLSHSKYVDRLKTVLSRFPNTPIVLCHCGMLAKPEIYYTDYPEYTNDQIWYIVCELMNQYGNLWTDLTYVAADYFAESPFKIYNLNMDRVILGTDLNPVIYKNETRVKQEIEKYNILCEYVNNKENINKLFNIK